MSPSASPSSIAIIGASLTGLELTMSLLQASLYQPEDIKLYDLRAATTPIPANHSGVVLTPNGLKILDSLGVLDRIKEECWQSEYRTYRNDKDELVRKTLTANEGLYGYKNHRTWRRLVLQALQAAIEEKGVKIRWQSKFEGVICETEQEVYFKVNGKEEHSQLLVGADDIYSTVRTYLDADAAPEYTGTIGVLAHIRWNEVQWPFESYERSCTIQGKPGAIFWIPEDKEGSVIMVGKQVKMEGKNRHELEEMSKDVEELRDFYRKDYDQWGDTAKQVIDAVCRNSDTFYVWPFVKMARLKRWYSRKGRVIIAGDAAHAIPPSSGQGVNQTLEDIYTLTKLLKSGRDRLEVLEFWQELRQRRIDAIYDWVTNATNIQRLPQAEREKMVEEGTARDANFDKDYNDMRWLYNFTFDQEIEEWLGQHERARN